MKLFLKDKKRVLMISLAVAVGLAVTGYALTVDSFADYNPPDYLYINWGDYLYHIGGVWTDSQARNNEPSENPRLTAEYPYRSVFYGRTGASVSTEKMLVIYSKKPATDLFTFQYMGSDKTGKSGRIRAFIDKSKINNIDHYNPENNSEILIYGPFGNGLDAATGVIVGSQNFANFNTSVSSHGSQGMQAYINFDFMYDCADEHQQGSLNLNMNGLTSISGVPYNYIIHCLDHTGYTGGGGSSPGGSGGLSGDKNTGGSGGKHGWGTGDYGGGLNKGDIVSPDTEISVPDDWKKPVEDNYNSMPDSEYKPDYPKYIPAEGDTGQNGENWNLPSFGDDDGVSGEVKGYKELIPKGEYGLIDFMEPWEEWFE